MIIITDYMYYMILYVLMIITKNNDQYWWSHRTWLLMMNTLHTRNPVADTQILYDSEIFFQANIERMCVSGYVYLKSTISDAFKYLKPGMIWVWIILKLLSKDGYEYDALREVHD